MRLAIIVRLPAALLVLAGCASYRPLPLALDAHPKDSLAALQHANPLPPRLGVDDVAWLVVQNNPELLAARAQAGLSQAQVLQAGILPNPALSASYGFLIGGPGTTNPFTVALSQDMRSLVTLSSRRRAALQSAHAVNASLLWEEWQTIAKARLQVVDLIEGEQQRQGWQQNLTLLLDRAARSREALARGDTTLTALLPELSAAAAARKQLDELERQQEARRRDLNRLLGLDPEVRLPLADSIVLSPIDAEAVRRSLGDLPARRPDLLALQLGYRSQEERLRAAILAQFPLLSLGISTDRDNTGVRSVAPQITLELPVFDRNQGNIAIERATRKQLHDEFTARVLAAGSELSGLLADQELLQGQLAGARSQLAELTQAAQRADIAFRAGDLDERSYIDVLSSRSAKNQEVLAMEQSLLEQQVAIATLSGTGMPAGALDGFTVPP
jgi:outer membrane protein TolC